MSVKESLLVPRLRRYLNEIGEALTQVLEESEAGGSHQSHDSFLMQVEQHITTDGLKRQVMDLQSTVLSLTQENEKLKGMENMAKQVEQMKEELQNVITDREKWKTAFENLQKTMEDSLKEHSEKYDELHNLFEKLTEESKTILQMSDDSNIKVERLKLEKASLEHQLEALEKQRKSDQDHFNALHKGTLAQVKETQEELTNLQAEYFRERNRGHQEAHQLIEQHKTTVQKQQVEIEKLCEEIKTLKHTISQLRENFQSVEMFMKQKETLEQELNTLRETKKQVETLQQHLKETKESCLLMKKKMKYKTHQKITEMEVQLNQKCQELDQWKDSAKYLHTCFTDDPKPGRFKSFLMTLNERRSKTFQDLERMNQENLRLESELQSTKDEVYRLQLELNEQKLRVKSAEYQASVLLGEWRSDQNIVTEHTSNGSCVEEAALCRVRPREGPSHPLPDEPGDEPKQDPPVDHSLDPSCNCGRAYRRQTVELMERLEKDRIEFSQAILEYKNRIHDVNHEKKTLLKNAQIAFENFSSLELLLNRTKENLSESHAVIQEQKKRIESLKAQTLLLRHDEPHILQAERDEAIKLAEMTREVYKNEAMTFRAIIKALLGWHIQIDFGSEQQDITVTLRPALVNQYSDEASLIFRVKRQPIKAVTPSSPKDEIEQHVYTMFRDEDFAMHLDGRFADQWNTDAEWKNQLSARCSYAAFLAITLLMEQNKILQYSAFLTVQQLKQKNTQPLPPQGQQ